MANFEELTDLQLAELLRSGSISAFQNLFDRYQSVLSSFSNYKTHNKELTQDIIQSTFAELWEHRGKINIPGRFDSYIYTIVRNKINDHYRHQNVSRRYQDKLLRKPEQTESSADHRLRYNELEKLITTEVNALPYHLKEVFLLSRKNALSRKEIAVQLNLTEEGVKTRMHRALKTLKKGLNPEATLKRNSIII